LNLRRNLKILSACNKRFNTTTGASPFSQKSFLSGLLARLCTPETFQPEINRLVELIYTDLISTVVNQEFELESFKAPTRMTEFHPHVNLQGTVSPHHKKRFA